MARPKSEDKRAAIIASATWAVSEFGLGAATSFIAKNAGVAEGTLFRYFATKDVLLNELYLHHIKNMGRVLFENHDFTQTPYHRSRQVWNNYIEWGLENTDAHNVLRKLDVSGKISKEVEEEGKRDFPDFDGLCQIRLTGDLEPSEEKLFSGAIFYALADTTIMFAANHPERKQAFIGSGFDVMWQGMMDNKKHIRD